MKLIINIILKGTSLKPWLLVVILFILSFTLRMFFLYGIWGLNSPVVDDGVDYHRIGVHLLTSGSFCGKTGITARRAPLYPFFISWIYRLGTIEPNWVRYVQVLLSSLLTILIFYGANFLYGQNVAVLSGLIATCYPIFIFLPSRLLTENLFTVLLLGAIIYLLKNAHHSGYQYCIAGSLLGLSILTRPSLVLVVPFIGLWLIGYRKGLSGVFSRLILLLAGIVITILPWSLRNYLVFNQFVPVTTNAGITLMHDNNPHLRDLGWAGPQNRIFKPEILFPELSDQEPGWRLGNEAEQDRILFRYTLRWIVDNPITFLSLLPRKMISFLNYRQGSNTEEVKSIVMDLVGLLSYGLLLPFMALGFGWTLKCESPQQRLLHYLIGSFLLSVLIYAGSLRLRVPIEPYLIIFAAYALVKLLNVPQGPVLLKK